MLDRLKGNRKLLLGLAFAVIGTAGIVWFVNRGNETPHTSPAPQDTTNYGPPTEQEIQETEQHKQELQKKAENEPTQPSPDPAAQASVVITYASYTDKAEVSGLVSNVFEDGGTCTLTLTKGALKASATSQGVTDVNKTVCPTIAINRDQLKESGDWTAVLDYSSNTRKGTSAPQTITVP